MDSQLIVGVDIGGTKTHLCAVRDGQVVAESIVQTEKWRGTQLSANAATLVRMVGDLGGASPSPAALVVGAHGCDSDWHCRRFQDAIDAIVSYPVLVVNDCELLLPAAGFSSGIGVVSGTGSIAVARAADGSMLSAGGWGWLLGDEGSAAGLVRDAARAVRAAIDRGEQNDPLVAMLLATLGLRDPIRLGRRLHEMGDGVAWGPHARVVFEAAADGSQVAMQLIEEAGEALAGLVSTLVQRGADARTVVAGGSMIAGQPLLMFAFRRAVTARHPDSEVVLLKSAPVHGAVCLADRITSATT